MNFISPSQNVWSRVLGYKHGEGDYFLPSPAVNSGVVVVVLITPPLARDGGTTRTAIQVPAVNLIEILG